jgi:hypothetical protein
MTVIVLVLLGVMVLAVTISPPQKASRTPTRDAVGVAAAVPLTDPDAFDVSATLSAAPGAEQKTVDAELGDRVEITVQGSSVDSVALGDLSVKGVEPGLPARFELLADTPGTYPLVLVNENRRIGALEIR